MHIFILLFIALPIAGTVIPKTNITAAIIGFIKIIAPMPAVIFATVETTLGIIETELDTTTSTSEVRRFNISPE